MGVTGLRRQRVVAYGAPVRGRLLLILSVVGAAGLGFGVGYVVFEGLPGGGLSAQEAEIQVARKISKDPDIVSCSKSEKVKGRWACNITTSVYREVIDQFIYYHAYERDGNIASVVKRNSLSE